MRTTSRWLVAVLVLMATVVTPGAASAADAAACAVGAANGAANPLVPDKAAAIAHLRKQVAETRRARGQSETPVDRGFILESQLPSGASDGSVGAGDLTTQALFSVWLLNHTSVTLEANIYWIDVYAPNTVKHTGGLVGSWQALPFGLNTCGSVIAYVMDIFYNGYYVATTGTQEPNDFDGDYCADAWAITG